MDIQQVIEKLTQNFEGEFGNIEENYGMTSIQVRRASIFKIVQYLKDDLSFNFMTDITGIHFPDNDEEMRFAVIYHMQNMFENVRVRLRVFLPENDLEVDSMTPLFVGANWMERETYDFFGIRFKNHPDLRRILNMDEMEVFPMRKEYPMEDAGRTDIDDRFFGRSIHNE